MVHLRCKVIWPIFFKKKKMNGIMFSSALKRALGEVKGG